MEKGDPRAVELLQKVMAAHKWDRSQLSDHVGKKRRTIDGIMRGELAMAQDLENYLQDLLKLAGAEDVRSAEMSPDYHLVKKVISIEEIASPEQLEMVDAFLNLVCEKLGLPRGDRKEKE